MPRVEKFCFLPFVRAPHNNNSSFVEKQAEYKDLEKMGHLPRPAYFGGDGPGGEK